MSNVIPFDVLNTRLSSFVATTCDGRDPSHGWEHMNTVQKNATEIFLHTIEHDHPDYDRLLRLTLTVAWLHDVYDHKYDHDGTLETQVQTFLQSITDEWELVMKIIERISFSKENKMKMDGFEYPYDWKNVIGDDGLGVRNIVSDADKLEAIGPIGITRCHHYTHEKFPDYTIHQSMDRIRAHAKEKLLHIKDEFMYTDHGKTLATPLHTQMDLILRTQLQEFLENPKGTDWGLGA